MNNVQAKPSKSGGAKKEKKKIKKDMAKVLNSKKSPLRKNLLAQNDYLISILDPFNKRGGKIPDLVTYPSSTFQITDRRQLAINANFLCGIYYGICGNTTVPTGSLVPVKWTNSSLGSTSYNLGMVTGASGTIANLWDAVTAAPITFPQWTVNGAADVGVPTLYQKARLVSMGLAVDYQGASLNSKGRILIGSPPRMWGRKKAFIGPIGTSDLLGCPGVRIIPVNRLDGATTVYHPIDTLCLEYTDLGQTYSSASFVEVDERVLAGELFAVVDGGTAGDLVQFTLVANYEAIPLSNQLDLVGTSESPSDPIALSHTFNTIQDLPRSFEGTGAAAGVITGAPQKGVPYHAGGGMAATTPKEAPKNMLDQVLEGVGMVADKVPDVVKKVAPLAEMALSFL
jgi:hypothetical protein